MEQMEQVGVEVVLVDVQFELQLVDWSEEDCKLVVEVVVGDGVEVVGDMFGEVDQVDVFCFCFVDDEMLDDMFDSFVDVV